MTKRPAKNFELLCVIDSAQETNKIVYSIEDKNCNSCFKSSGRFLGTYCLLPGDSLSPKIRISGMTSDGIEAIKQFAIVCNSTNQGGRFIPSIFGGDAAVTTIADWTETKSPVSGAIDYVPANSGQRNLKILPEGLGTLGYYRWQLDAFLSLLKAGTGDLHERTHGYSLDPEMIVTEGED